MEYTIRYTNQAVTPWGRMVLLRQMLNKIGFKRQVEQCGDLPAPGSNRGYSRILFSKHLVRGESFFFLHTEITRQDEVLKQIFG
jgi:hypothetical protein